MGYFCIEIPFRKVRKYTMKEVLLALTILIIQAACGQTQTYAPELASDQVEEVAPSLKLGAERFDIYLPLLQDRPVALVVNQTSKVGPTHLVDTLLSLGVDIKKVFAPEHGFRGAQEAGETVNNSVDQKTGIAIQSLYGANKKPSEEHLSDVEVVLFDIQDVGVRFYTYISTMHYVMEACAEQNKEFIVLDRPNPNGDYVAGPILQSDQQSFVGLHPIPIVHGLTVGELAQMIQGEGWLQDGVEAKLQVVSMNHYNHDMVYDLPVKPSPNLPNYQAIRLYPSLCLFEGSQISVGRGTEFPFQVFGDPNLPDQGFSFTPVSMVGMDQNPKHKDLSCYGEDLRSIDPPQFTLDYLLYAYQHYPQQDDFFKKYFHKLAGTSQLMQQIKDGKTQSEIMASWETDLAAYKNKRQKYLLYP